MHLRVAADARWLSAVRALVRQYVEACGMAEARAQEVVLAVDEACTNSIRHAYGGRRGGWLELTCRSSDRAVEFVLCDDGAPCPDSELPPQGIASPDPDSVEPGGLGLDLIYRVFDDVDFQPGKERGNTLRMRADLSRGGPRKAAGGA
jgi:anti-sigma regulatory factor (Ser/Thr protein kinase)